MQSVSGVNGQNSECEIMKICEKYISFMHVARYNQCAVVFS